jgi:hypothetical protein
LVNGRSGAGVSATKRGPRLFVVEGVFEEGPARRFERRLEEARLPPGKTLDAVAVVAFRLSRYNARTGSHDLADYEDAVA